MYSIYDSYGNLVKSGFPNWKSAYTYIISRQRKEYKQYLPKEVCAEIAKELGIEYKPKK